MNIYLFGQNIVNRERYGQEIAFNTKAISSSKIGKPVDYDEVLTFISITENIPKEKLVLNSYESIVYSENTVYYICSKQDEKGIPVYISIINFISSFPIIEYRCYIDKNNVIKLNRSNNQSRTTNKRKHLDTTILLQLCYDNSRYGLNLDENIMDNFLYGDCCNNGNMASIVNDIAPNIIGANPNCLYFYKRYLKLYGFRMNIVLEKDECIKNSYPWQG